MRKAKLYQIMDLTAENVVGPILTAYADAAAIRQFTDLLRDPKTLPAQHPEDFNLIHLGYQDESTGAIDPIYGTPEIVLTGKAFVELQRSQESAP